MIKGKTRHHSSNLTYPSADIYQPESTNMRVVVAGNPKLKSYLDVYREKKRSKREQFEKHNYEGKKIWRAYKSKNSKLTQ